MHGNEIFLLFLAASVALLIGILTLARAQARKRTQALQTVAQEIGFSFEGEGWGVQTQAPQLETPLFERGRDQKFSNVLSGMYSGFKTSVFDYSFRTGGGKNSHTWNQTVAAFSQDLWLPLFQMRPENFLDRIGDAFTHKDIDFDSHPEFSKRYLLRGTDPDKIRELFTPALLTFLEKLTPSKKWHMEGVGLTLMFYRYDATVSAEEIRSFLDETSLIAKTFFSSCGLKRRLDRQ